MKLVVIGVGQCGGRIADEFVRLDRRARRQRGIPIAIDTFAVNTDATDLAGLKTVMHDYRHRILIGAGKTHGHGVAKISELGAEIAKEDADKVIDAVKQSRDFYEADAFLLICGTAGGTGSGVTPVFTRVLKERFTDKPVYALVVLPFEHEEATEERTIYNTAMCLKSITRVADAVILFDNQRYVRKDASLTSNMHRINELIVEPFYNLLCAGEEREARYIGTRTLDAADIRHTLVGWTVIGYGRSSLQRLTLPFRRRGDYLEKGDQTQKGLRVMDEAVSELSIGCNTADAGRTLFLLSAPAREVNVDLVKELCDYLRGMAPKALLRNGDYPRVKGRMEVTVVLSELGGMEKIREYYRKAAELAKEFKRRQKARAGKPSLTEEAGEGVPTLL